ncbi:MAG TPA: AAA family ATPase [Solirubrobacteraceae bacterium]|nr:AAA family ATPase [Solirubrobacteraceae bacterium]
MAALAELELLEREPELATLRPVLEAAREGAGRLVVIEGPPGIGKTRLVAAARALAADAGLETLWGRGGEFEHEFPYGVARQLFEPVLGRLDAAEREELLAGAAGLAAPLFDPLRAGADAGADNSFATAHGLYWMLVNLAARRPVLVAVDDLHWVDPPSLRFLAYLQRRLEGLRVVLLTGLRPGEAVSGDPPPVAVIDDPGRVLLRPRPLTPAAAARYVAATLGCHPDDEFADACHRASGGNPLLLRELLITLKAEGVAPDAGNAASVQPLGSEALANLVRLRLARLGAHAAALAAAAAVLGDGSPVRLAAELAGLAGEAADEATDRLVRADVLRHDAVCDAFEVDAVRLAPAVAFVHPVVRSALYADLAPVARARLHGEAARVLAAAGGQPERVASHLLSAPPAGDAWAVGELRRAAALALGEGAADAAASYLRRALDEPPPADDRPALMLELGIAELRTRPPAAIEPLETAVSIIDDPDDRAEAALELARALTSSGRLRDAVDVLSRALDDLRAAPDRLARLEAEMIGLARFLPDLYDFAADRLTRIRLPLRPEGEVLTTGEAMLLAAVASQVVREGERRDEALALAHQALAGGQLLEEINSPAFAIAVQCLTWCDELETALALYDEGIADARARGAISRFALGSGFRAGVAYRLGALAEAEADARTACGAAGTGGGDLARYWGTSTLADVLLERGEIAAAAALFDGLPLSGDDVESGYFRHPAQMSRALVRLAQGRATQAAADLLALGRELGAVGIHSPSITQWRSRASMALLRAGEADRARALAAEEVELARRWGAPRALGVALRVHGLTVGGDDGLALLEEAVAVLEPSPARLERARALADFGGALRRGGRRVDSREPLRLAVELAQACGATPLADAARTELVAAGAKPRRQALSGAESLTPSELRVAAMAAEGMTNRDIAQNLFVTPKTVEVHLSSVYRKLDIGSRTQLASALGV